MKTVEGFLKSPAFKAVELDYTDREQYCVGDHNNYVAIRLANDTFTVDDLSRLGCDLGSVQQAYDRWKPVIKEFKLVLQSENCALSNEQLAKEIKMTLEQEYGNITADVKYVPTEQELHDAVVSFLTIGNNQYVGNKVPAIKEYRRLTGACLKEAKEAVERIGKNIGLPEFQSY